MGVRRPRPAGAATDGGQNRHLRLRRGRDHEIFEELSEGARAYVYPIGMADRRNQYLGMAPNGAVYVGMDYVNLLADTADEALEKLIVGLR
ncbi:SUKH-3 domain-containing protein [Streptomyces sp. PH10-H1]|uniref:SUKH-3 domain-containing protein n=1 Tax=Streptomyces sp. PH10-H1 TaxID=3046212 RepID=UPI0024B9DD09|nr:SUKH-3 domain-containing protein [Streptomyces sp. PH10-H1]MDJ0340355.1 SUKH-3 domain-containing protein [Streptomyces sp. PH10-H1]